MKAPFPWFGGKSRVAHVVWDRFGKTNNYVEPFAGSLAVLLSRPWGPGSNETVNDKDCYLANFWRALQSDPEKVAHYADWPVNEADLHARHRWLVKQAEFRERMAADPEYFDTKIAGWWVWGLSLWIGGGWCVHPQWLGRAGCQDKNRGLHAERWKKRPQTKRGGNGVHRASHAEDVWLQKPDISGNNGASGRGIHTSDLIAYFEALASRLRRVRVCCGDWKRVLGPSPTTCIGLTAVLLDPPYSVEDRSDCYAEESRALGDEVRQWALDHGPDPMFRIALCGYEGEHKMPANWHRIAWKANGGYGNQSTNTRGRENASRERIWFSPHCLRATLFESPALEEEIAI